MGGKLLTDGVALCIQCTRHLPRGQLPIAKADLNNYDRDTSATRLQSCFCRRWRVVTSRRPKENCLCCTHLYTLQPKRSPIATEFHEVLVMIPKRTLWFQNVRIWLQNRRFGSKTAAEKTHPSTPLPLGTTGQDETALQDDRPVACVGFKWESSPHAPLSG